MLPERGILASIYDIHFISLIVERKENHFVRANLIVKGQEIPDVPCKVFLPERIYERPRIVFKPSQKQGPSLAMDFKCALSARVLGLDQPVLTIEAPEVYLLNHLTTTWGPDLSETTVDGDPQHLHIVQFFSNPNQKKTHITFWISPNDFLTPAVINTASYTGEVKVKLVRQPLCFNLAEGFKVVFEKQFGSRYEKQGDFVQWPFLVANAELENAADDVVAIQNNCLRPLDDFLLIASLAFKRRTACLGWNATDARCLATYYRGNFSFPDCNKRDGIRDALIEIDKFEAFMASAYPTFLAFGEKQILRSAIYSVIPDDSATVETAFLRMFAGLESLVLDFRRRENLEHVLRNSNDWTKLKKYLRKSIKDSVDPKLDTTQRDSMYRKLEELNRVSLAEAFNAFCDKFSIPLRDLWPVFGDSQQIGLADIRNSLIHGDPFPVDELLSGVAIAERHLRYTLERALCRVLDWSICDTTSSPAYLARDSVAIRDLASARERLSRS